MAFLERFVNRPPSREGSYRLSSTARNREPFLRRHFWPPSAFGTIVLAVVVSVITGLLAAVYYTASESKAVQLRDPDGPVEEQPGADDPDLSIPVSPTTTRLEVFSVEALAKEVAPSIWSVSTLDEAGRPVEAAAVVAGSFGGQSFLLTPLAVVRASTRVPGPEITVRNGGTSARATLWTWQEDKDLALLVISRSAPPLTWAADNTDGLVGSKVYVAAPGAPLAPGVVSGVAPDGIRHNVFVEGNRQGAPLVNQAGELLGMVSLDYNPGGVGTDRIFVAVPVRLACEKVLTCNTKGAEAPATPETPAPTTPD